MVAGEIGLAAEVAEELLVAGAKTAAGRAVVQAGAHLGAEAAHLMEHSSGAEFIKHVVKSSWAEAPFKSLAEEQARRFDWAAAKRVAPTNGFYLPVARVADNGEHITSVHPVLSAALRGDKALWKSAAEKNNPFNTAYRAEQLIGLQPRTLRPEGQDFGLRMFKGHDVQQSGNDVAVYRFDHGGFTPGYIHNAEAYARIADRYGFNVEQVSSIRMPGNKGYSTDQLRQIETHLKLEKGSLRYEPDGLTLHDRDINSTPNWQYPSTVRCPCSASRPRIFRRCQWPCRQARPCSSARRCASTRRSPRTPCICRPCAA